MAESPLAKALGYSKFRSGEKVRMMIMKSKYFVNDDVVSGAKAMGWDVFELPVNMSGTTENSFLTDMLQSLVSFRPDFVLTINHGGFDNEGVLAGILNSFNVPLASWFVDHPVAIIAGSEKNVQENTQIFCFERTALSWLSKVGFEDPIHLPTASNQKVFHPSLVDINKATNLGESLVLVAGSWWQRARETSTPEVKKLATQMLDENAIDHNLLRHHLHEFEYIQASPDSREKFAAIHVALAELTMNKRAKFITALKELNPVVYGDEHWKELVNGVELRGPVHNTKELPSLFAGSKVNLNVTAEQMPTAVNQRVWDVPGIGGFLLTDAQDDVLEYFEDGEDVAIYHNLDEAVDKASFYVANDSLRNKIAHKALIKIDREHRINHRLITIETVMSKRFG